MHTKYNKSLFYVSKSIVKLTCGHRILAGLGFRSSVFERIARFLPKHEQMSNSLKKMNDSLICSFLVSDLSDSLTIAHFL